MNGTVFIDEISEAPLAVQIKLLRILQEKKFSRVGGDALISANFRLITASNKDLAAQVAAGEFRQDLWYRINILELRLPALKERPGDVMLIIASLLEKQDKSLSFTDEAVSFLISYAWPGNIRELQAAIFRLIVLQSLCQLSAVDSDHQYTSTTLTGEVDLLKKEEQKLMILPTECGQSSKRDSGFQIVPD